MISWKEWLSKIENEMNLKIVKDLRSELFIWQLTDYFYKAPRKGPP